ncbi:RnfABCDGE type electron transport complex subunit B [Caldichromatium japonicum]|uniref:Ion-translocating oxidoreductase complex subunit B n=1 Tax=Caldichromatium japonicum TaxID=2699430 RepID=A0A6G7VEP5_9GAMM|nr:RnfABCDGE type electron transport complex subunit B [Caldichromatium japonicum]QIK38444.1 RnfABCDGE type electron transport complex subunit B [Caldichromatium japonicum]
MNIILTAAGFMTALGMLLALLLAIANRRFYVFEDPRIDQVEDLLPKANCGACGEPGCRPFAEKLVKGEAEPARCTVNAKTMNQRIAELLGVELQARERWVARLACAGGGNVAAVRAYYHGIPSCRAAALVSGGGRSCAWGCLGFGDCVTVCRFGALSLNRQGLPVVNEERCTACGDCVTLCPKGLFSLHPASHRLWVACMSLDPGEQAEEHCEVACTGCGRCAQDSPEGLIQIRNNLAVIDYDKNVLASKVAIERCPTGAIVWFEPDGRAVKGREARKVIRKGAKAALPAI